MEREGRKEERGGERFGFQWASRKKKNPSKCVLHGWGGRGAHNVVMFWLGLALASPSCLCSV